MVKAEEWLRLVDHLSALYSRTADQEYLLGLSLARLENLDEAEEAFRAGRRKAPADSRFPLGLAGLEFKRGRLSRAEAWLNEARRKGAGADYLNEFLGTIYYLRENLEAALKYWNRLGRPEITALQYESVQPVDPVLFDRFFTFSRNEILTLKELRATQRRIEAARIFSRIRFQLEPAGERTFELRFLSSPRAGVNHGKRAALFTMLKELPFETVRVDLYNPWGEAIAWENSYRWESTRQRLLSRFARRLKRAPQWGYWILFDLRSEVWELNPDFAAVEAGSFDFEKVGGSAGFEYLGGDDWTVNSDFHLGWREFDRLEKGDDRFHDGALLRYETQISHVLWRRPEEDLKLETYVKGGLGSVPSDDRSVFSIVEGGLSFSSYFDRSDHDWEVIASARAGRIGEEAPFDQLFILGVDQDSDLWLRGHPATEDGRKGNSPIGNQYLLLSLGIMRPLWENGLINLEIGPFLDSGWIKDTAGQFAPEEWLVDLGVQLNVRLLGDLVVQLSYGRDLKNGDDSFRALPRSRAFP